MPKPSAKINSGERDICGRLKLFRESIGWGQIDFSKRLGLSLNQLAGVEYARIPLRYSVAWNIREVFGLSLTWLVNGRYPPNERDLDPWPNPQALKNGRFLLSEVERTLWFPDPNSPAIKEAERAWWKNRREKGIQKPRRGVHLSILKESLQEWLALIPEGKIDEFATELFHCGQTYTENYLGQPGNKVGLRTRALIWGEMREEINKRLMPRTHANLHLTDSETSATLASDVKPQLPNLLARLNRATGPTGKMSALADFLGKAAGHKVPLASVSRWLSGKREPGGEIALLMLRWVEQQERQQ